MRRNIIILFCLVFSAEGSVFSEEQNTGAVTAAVFTYVSDESQTYSFRDVINNAVSLELKASGFLIITPDYMESTEKPVQSAYSAGASILIESNYSIANESINIDFTYYRTDNNSRIFSTSISGALDLELDTVIKEGALELITRIKQDIENRPFPVSESTGSIEEEETELSAAESEEATDETVKAAKTTHTQAEIQVTEPDDFRHFTISAGFSPFMTTGDASNYFTFGMAPDIYAGYRFHTAFGYFGLGISSSLNYFTAEGILLSSDNMLISAGPEIRLGFDASPFLGIFLRLNSGGTLFMLNKNNEGYQSTIIPFVSGGMGLTLNMTQGFGIIVSTNYNLYIESSILITGFSPSVGIHFNL